MKIDKRLITYIILLILVILAVAYLIISNFRMSNIATTNDGCVLTKGIEVCVSSSKSTLSSSETSRITTTVSNTTDKDLTEIFSCTDTEPSVTINDDVLAANMTVCGQAITKHTIPAHRKEVFSYDVSGSDLKDGKNIISVIWASYKGKSITINKKSISQKESLDEFTTCQNLKDDIDFNEIPRFCGSINVILQENDGGYTCKYWKGLIGKVSLKLPCTNVMSDGVGYIWLPKEYLEKYSENIKKLPGVEDVSISD
ncbi:MAG: hypothetical protein AAB395_03760 [Patescibacteria group bacterium]